MPNYYDLANTKMPSLAEMVQRLRQRKAAQEAAKRQAGGPIPGGNPAPDAAGGPMSVQLPGEGPIQAQPVGAPLSSVAPRRGGMTMTPGTPSVRPVPRQVTLPPQQIQISGQPPAQDPRNAKLRELMAQGMSFRDAMMAVQGG